MEGQQTIEFTKEELKAMLLAVEVLAELRREDPVSGHFQTRLTGISEKLTFLVNIRADKMAYLPATIEDTAQPGKRQLVDAS